MQRVAKKAKAKQASKQTKVAKATSTQAASNDEDEKLEVGDVLIVTRMLHPDN